MKKVFAVFLALAVGVIIILAIATSVPKIVDETPIDCRYTPSFQGMETTYEYKFDYLGEETFKLMPNYHTKIYPEKYEVEYRRTFDDGGTNTYWEEVSRDEYHKVKKILEGK